MDAHKIIVGNARDGPNEDPGQPPRHLTLFLVPLQYGHFFSEKAFMWKRNFMFRAQESAPLEQSENELFHDTEPALDSAGMHFEKFISVWVQGEGDDQAPTAYTNLYVRTATLDFKKRAGFLQPLQGRSHQIKQLLTPGQKAFLKDWLSKISPSAWNAAEDHFRALFETD